MKPSPEILLKEAEACSYRVKNRSKPNSKLSSLHKMPREEEDKRAAYLIDKLDASLERNHYLEKENEQLKQELLHLKARFASLQAQVADKKSMLWKKLQSSISSNSSSQEKQMLHSNIPEEALVVESSMARQEIFEWPPTTKGRSPRMLKPPPIPTHLPLTPEPSGKEALFPPPPPPPPPLPSKTRGGISNAVRRVPEVVELYRSLTRKNGKPKTKAGIIAIPAPTNSREMIGEIEKRSAYLIAVKSDVVTQGKFINFLAKKIENAAFREISDVETFVKWLDEELSYLVDERAVLKHFPQWPEQKADAMREAAFNYRDLKNLESEISSFNDSIHHPTPVALKLMQALQDKLERSVHNLEKVRESTSKRYRDFKIPWQWMLNTGIITQLKLGSIQLAKVYMNRVVTALQSDASLVDEDLMLQGVRFSFQVHQFVGGFDEECRHAFQELKKFANSSYMIVPQPAKRSFRA